jgi:hypothetical protein
VDLGEKGMVGMPLRNRFVHCVNHPNIEMLPNANFSALNRATVREGETFRVDHSPILPVKAFVCPECGYVELYHASRVASWPEDKTE